MFRKRRKKSRQHESETSTSSTNSTSSTKPVWLPSKVQGIVYSLRAQQKEWRTNRSLAARWSRYSPNPLRRLKRLFSTSSEPNLSDSDGQKLSEDEWDAGTLRREESQKDLREVGTFEVIESTCEEVGSTCHGHQESEEEKFHWVDSSTSLKLKEPNKHYYVLTPGIAHQSDSSSCDLTVQFHHEEDKCGASSMIIQNDQEVASGTLDNKSSVQESVDSFERGRTKPLSLCETKIAEEKCLPVLDLEAIDLCVVNNNMPIVIENPEKKFEIDTHPFHLENCVVAKENSVCCDEVSDVQQAKSSMVPPSIVLQQPEQVTILELSPARPSISRLHLTTDVADVGSRKSPVTVQEWVDSLPLQLHRGDEENDEPQSHEPDEHLDLGLGAEAGLLFAVCPEVEVSSVDNGSMCKKANRKEGFVREASLQSDITSRTGSSMESYLESRRADPEEVLLGLGFGGSGGGVQSEVSRIPRRFLQPSQVKGVAVDDFLHYQQELIEKFETGFSGYRGLVGPSHTPSVIVAKIMEKLRDHERESSCRSSVISHPSTSTPVSAPAPAEPKKFSHVARRVMKRTNVTSALSVLNPANREFLNSQGSKSPEIPRKRMIIGQRSFTFSGDGNLIEVESCPSSPSTTCSRAAEQGRGPAKRLVHKDSVLSLATSASMTSIDSDSDLDDWNSEYEMCSRMTRPSLMPRGDVGSSLPPVAVLGTPAPVDRHKRVVLDKRMSSTSLSSWEMDTSAHVAELSSRLSSSPGLDSDSADEGLKSRGHFNAYNFPRTKCESIDEDVSVEALSQPRDLLRSSNVSEKVETVSDVEIGTEASEELCDLSTAAMDETVASASPPASVQRPQTPTCLAQDQVCMLHRDRPARRGSLKRQQHIMEDENWEGEEGAGECEDPVAPPANNNLLQLVPDTRGDSFEMEEILLLDEEKELLLLTRTRSDSSGFLDGDATDNLHSRNCSPNNGNSTMTDQAVGTLVSCQSTTDSGVVSESVKELGAEYEDVFTQDIDSGNTRLVTHRDDEAVVRFDDNSSLPLENMPAEEYDVWSMLGIWGNDKYMKRLSLPVVCVHDELGNMSRLTSSSSRSCASDEGSTVTCAVRRVRSAPQSLCDAGELRTTTIQTCSSFSNMFSFCSDESVIHISSTKGGARSCGCRHGSSANSRRQSASFDNLNVQHSGHYGPRHSFQESRALNFQQAADKHEPRKHTAKDLQELIHELTARGSEVGNYFNTHNACHSEPQQAHMHASILRLAVEAYKKQLSVGPEVLLDGLHECTEAEQELEVTRNICSRITAELRHIADLLEEEPTVRMANVTCQMTELLREQTRLYEQLTLGDSPAMLPPDVVALHSSPKPQANGSQSDHCCCGKQIISVVKEEHGRLEQLIKKNTDELIEIRRLLCELLSKNSDSLSQVQKQF